MAVIQRDALASAVDCRTYNRVWQLGIAGTEARRQSGSLAFELGIDRMADDALTDRAERREETT